MLNAKSKISILDLILHLLLVFAREEPQIKGLYLIAGIGEVISKVLPLT